MALNLSGLGVYDPTQFVGPLPTGQAAPTGIVQTKPNKAMPQANPNAAALAPLTSTLTNGTSTTYNPLSAYNTNPAPTSGSGTAYGKVPGTIAVPPSTWEQTMAQPGMQSQFTATQGVVNNQLAGQLPQEVVNQIQDKAAQFGVTSGMPGSQFQGYQGLRNLGVDMLGYQQQGVTNSQNLAALVKSGQIDPALAAQIASHNADLNAAPDPKMAADQQMANWQQQLNAMKTAYPNYGSGTTINTGPAGGTTNTPAAGTTTTNGTSTNKTPVSTTPSNQIPSTPAGANSFTNQANGTLTGGTTGGGAFPTGYNANALGLPGGVISGGTGATTAGGLTHGGVGSGIAGGQVYNPNAIGLPGGAASGAGTANIPQDTSNWTESDWQSLLNELYGGTGQTQSTTDNSWLQGTGGGTYYDANGNLVDSVTGDVIARQTQSGSNGADTSGDGIDWNAFNSMGDNASSLGGSAALNVPDPVYFQNTLGDNMWYDPTGNYNMNADTGSYYQF